MGEVRYLLDTHTLLWWAFDAPELSPTARGLIADRANTVLVSAASSWEITTKFRLGRLPEAGVLVQDVHGWITRAGLAELPISIAHASRAGMFPQAHRDPFDRLLAAQAVTENLPIISKDSALAPFGASLIW